MRTHLQWTLGGPGEVLDIPIAVQRMCDAHLWRKFSDLVIPGGGFLVWGLGPSVNTLYLPPS